ncbi:MAG: hypothetical protein U0T69_11190 [Chitinophagales bacterium]
MTAKEKAIELVEKFLPFNNVFDLSDGWVQDITTAKQCALICVQEILNNASCGYCENLTKEYWQEVKKEIENS